MNAFEQAQVDLIRIQKTQIERLERMVMLQDNLIAKQDESMVGLQCVAYLLALNPSAN